jgi:hypothetical protein
MVTHADSDNSFGDDATGVPFKLYFRGFQDMLFHRGSKRVCIVMSLYLAGG